jgi:hypothetical protein
MRFRKRVLIIGISLLLMISVSSCDQTSKKSEINDGKYTLKVSEKENAGAIVPAITISDGTFTFSYDPLSSYLSYGEYDIQDDRLILTTVDEKNQYTFQINGKSLFFIEEESSDVKLLDANLGIQVVDRAEFVYKN